MIIELAMFSQKKKKKTRVLHQLRKQFYCILKILNVMENIWDGGWGGGGIFSLSSFIE